MRKKIFKLLAILIYSCAQNSIALPNNIPTCPTVSAIQQSGVNKWVTQDWDGRWIAGDRNRFNTQNCWKFNTNPFSAKNHDDAINKVTSALSSLVLVKGPIEVRSGDWECFYQTLLGDAFATTPTFYGCDD